ncbi:MAG: LysR family transcriptional regulator [Proteobacteria bacterium]|nr:LysR family transcriptional regulator [Pseudomonadota bacterium]
MELRHLRCFLAVAEELHFARAAERLHIDQSPLSRTIKELEEELGARLFVRTTRSTQLTRAGRLFLEHVPRVFTALEQARDSVKSAVNGFCGQLRIALSDGITPSRLPALLAQCREEDPEVEVRLGVGAELAAPENRQDGNRIVIAGRDSAQDSINQVGQEITRRNMNIQPTLTERPGLPVRIIVNRDLVLRPYQPLFFNRGASQ